MSTQHVDEHNIQDIYSGKGIYSCHSHNKKLFEQIEHSGIRLGINVNETKATAYNFRADVVHSSA